MTTFNPENKEVLSYDECTGPAMKIVDAEDAAQYKAAYIDYVSKFHVDGKSENGLTTEEVVNHNLGYFAGYYSDETRERVERLFNCSHPVFGSIKENGAPTAAEAFHMGMAEMAKRKKH